MTHTTKAIAILAFISLLTAANAVSAQSCCGMGKTVAATPAKSGTGRGLVKAIHQKTKTITLSHNDIPGIMMAMTMDYPVKKAGLLKGINVGDSVTFTLKSMKSGEYMVAAISILPKN
jgi:Cu/Ag efflux protein CusF